MSRKPKPPRIELAGIDNDTQTTAQEAVPLRWAFGENAIPVTWGSSALNLTMRKSKNSRGKK